MYGTLRVTTRFGSCTGTGTDNDILWEQTSTSWLIDSFDRLAGDRQAPKGNKFSTGAERLPHGQAAAAKKDDILFQISRSFWESITITITTTTAWNQFNHLSVSIHPESSVSNLPYPFFRLSLNRMLDLLPRLTHSTRLDSLLVHKKIIWARRAEEIEQSRRNKVIPTTDY